MSSTIKRHELRAQALMLIGGGSGVGTPLHSGYYALEEAFQEYWDVLIPRPSGQERRPGYFSLRAYMQETVAQLKNWLLINPNGCWAAIGISAGGVIAGHLSAQIPGCVAVVTYETPLRWTQEMQDDLRMNSEKVGLRLSDDFFDSILHLETANPLCPVMHVNGTVNSKTFSEVERQMLLRERYWWQNAVVDGAGHRLFINGSTEALTYATDTIKRFINEQKCR